MRKESIGNETAQIQRHLRLNAVMSGLTNDTQGNSSIIQVLGLDK